jgi:hypothetical protein
MLMTIQWNGSVFTVKTNTEILVIANKQIDLEGNAEKLSIWQCLT